MPGIGLEIKQRQKLNPVQIQTVKLIEMPIQDLEQRIKEELEENPVLDNEELKGEDLSLDELNEDDYIPRYRTYVNNRGRDEEPEYNPFSVKESFTQSLRDQLGFRNLTDHQRQVADFILGSLDPDGYLRRDVETLTDDMAFKFGISTTDDEVRQMLSIIQEFEPAGVGARNLQECMLLQLCRMNPTPTVENGKKIVSEYFDEFINKHFAKLGQKLALDQDQLKETLTLLQKLNPKPGGQVDDTYNDRGMQVVPDFILQEDDTGKLSFIMPRCSVPELKVNPRYEKMLQESKGQSDRSQKETITFIRQKLDSAKWFVEAVKQRHNTLRRTMQAILDYQYDFFEDGDESSLKPMVLKDIAAVTGFDISTISRVVNSKYIDTPFGIYPLKYFFSEGLENAAGEEVSTRELKNALKGLVAEESKMKPLTDEQLVDKMTALGYKVARRTIAKYRSQLDIPTARLRKEL